MPQQQLSKNIRAVREYYGLTQKKFASYIGASHKTVWSWENTKLIPRLYFLIAIKHQFLVTIDDLCKKDLEAYFSQLK